MVWLNTEHKNDILGKDTYGGSMCTCIECQKERDDVYLNTVNKYLFYFDTVIQGWVPCPRLTGFFIGINGYASEFTVKFKCLEMTVKEFKILGDANGSL